MADVALKGLGKRFDRTLAVADLTLTVADRELVVLLGPTGAGKTTTLRLVAGLEQPSSGAIHIGGRDVSHLSPAARDVCFVFHQYSLYPHYTVYDNLAFPLRAPGRDLSAASIDARVKEIAALLRIDHKLTSPSTRLSGGEMQRVALGRALVRDPAIFLMDEPLSSLDAQLREDLRIELKRIQQERGATILFASHDPLEAMTLGDRIAVLSEGRLVQVGAPRELYERPYDVYVARRLGSPPINLLDLGLLPVVGPPPAAATVGVRPEDVELNIAAGALGVVRSVEHLGREVLVVLDLAGHTVRAYRGRHGPLSPGDWSPLGVRRSAVHFFDHNGVRIPERHALPEVRRGPSVSQGGTL
jgi:multiple sugar transport system ATP-binding protein